MKFVGGVLVMAAVACYLAPDSHAAGCAERSAAHIAEHGGLYADSAWHVANGELPTCGGNAEASTIPVSAKGGGGADARLLDNTRR